MDTFIYKCDKSTIYHWFGYWLGVFFIAYLCRHLNYLTALGVGVIGSQIFWFLKELLWDGLYRKQPINLADILGGWLFLYVFKALIKTQLTK